MADLGTADRTSMSRAGVTMPSDTPAAQSSRPVASVDTAGCVSASSSAAADSVPATAIHSCRRAELATKPPITMPAATAQM